MAVSGKMPSAVAVSSTVNRLPVLLRFCDQRFVQRDSLGASAGCWFFDIGFLREKTS